MKNSFISGCVCVKYMAEELRITVGLCVCIYLFVVVVTRRNRSN